MALYPVFIDWQGVPCLVAGGGAVALHKAELLCAQGAAVTVVSPEVCPALQTLPVRLYLRAVERADVHGQRLVVDATGDAETGRLLREACRAAHIPFNSASQSPGGTAIFPAVHRQGRLLLAVSGQGASPAASAMLRDLLAAHIPAGMDEILDAMAALRPLARAAFPAQRQRSLFLHRCLDEMMHLRRALRPEELDLLQQSVAEEENTAAE